MSNQLGLKKQYKILLGRTIAIAVLCVFMPLENTNATELGVVTETPTNTQTQKPASSVDRVKGQYAQRLRARFVQKVLYMTLRDLESFIGHQKSIGTVNNAKDANQKMDVIERLLTGLELEEKRASTEKLSLMDLDQGLKRGSLILGHSAAIKQFIDANPEWLSVNNGKNARALMVKLKRLKSLISMPKPIEKNREK